MTRFESEPPHRPAQGVAAAGGWLRDVTAFIEAVLRGIGQVMLQDNRQTGLLFLLGIAWHSPRMALAVLLATAISTATALALRADRAALGSGLYGFNGALVGVAVLVFFRPSSAITWGLVAFGAIGAVGVTAALQRVLEAWKLPGLTAPFVFVVWCLLLAAAVLPALPVVHAAPVEAIPQAALPAHTVSAATLAQGVLNGVGQVFLQADAVTGALFLLGLLASSRRAAALALLGSAIGWGVAWALGADEAALRTGVFGFNGVLVAIALGTQASARWRSIAYVGLALVAAPVVAAGLSAALEPAGLPVLTFPFVGVTWVFLLARPRFKLD